LCILLAAVCALTMPSLHAVGTELPHPHAFFQLWCAADGADHSDQASHVSEGTGSEPTAATVGGRPDRPTIEQSPAPFESGSALALASRGIAYAADPPERSAAVAAQTTCPPTRLFSPDPPPPRPALA
jgi:hypothetical protein